MWRFTRKVSDLIDSDFFFHTPNNIAMLYIIEYIYTFLARRNNFITQKGKIIIQTKFFKDF